MIKRYLLHANLLLRFGSLSCLVMIAFGVAWTVSYFFLPEGLLRGRRPVDVIAGGGLLGDKLWLEWLRIFALNLGAMATLVLLNVLRGQHDFPWGYGAVTILAIVCGIVMGTDSFIISVGGKKPPTLDIFGHSGPYEIASYVLAVAATASISKYHLVGKWPKQKFVRIIPPGAKSGIRECYIGVLLAIAILLLACGWEAYQISMVCIV